MRGFGFVSPGPPSNVPGNRDRTILDDLRTALHPAQRDDPLLPGLAAALAGFIAAPDTGARLAGWLALHEWTRAGTRLPDHADDSADGVLGAADTARLRLLLRVLEAAPAVRDALHGALAAVFAGTDATNLLAETGIPHDRGFAAEAARRLWAKVLPEPRDPQELAQFMRHSFPREGHIARLRYLPPDLFVRLLAVAMPPVGSTAWQPLRRAVGDALRLLCTRVEAQGLSRHLRARSTAGPVTASPFWRLPRAGDGLLAAWDGAGDLAAAHLAWSDAIAACRREMAEIHRQIAGEGVSVDIVFGLQVLDRCLDRLALLGEILASPEGAPRAALIHRLISRLALQAHQDRSLRALAATNLRLLHQRIVERSSETGEHYIARDRSEYRHLLLAAAGGGLLTVGTAAVKLGASQLPGSDFLHGLLYGLNYAVSFMILHHCHLVLATKQPAMTAATLATIMRSRSGNEALDEIVDRIARICHSQLAAAAGNVAVVAVGALAFSWLWTHLFGMSFLTAEKAEATYASFSPLNSGTVFFAALTGVILWLSSLIGGWIDNWSAWHRIPEGIADHPLGLRFGRERAKRWSALWGANIAGWGTNISLGFMLGMTPAIGHFLGLPLDVRHVTLSTGTLFFACGSLDDQWFSRGFFLLALAGIGVMFVLNLGVSFALSLWTAIRALGIPRSQVLELLRRLGTRMLTHPGDFIMPPRTPLRGESL